MLKLFPLILLLPLTSVSFATDYRLDGPGQPLENYVIHNQGSVPICYAQAGAVLLDHYFNHIRTPRPATQAPFYVSPLWLAVMEDKNRLNQQESHACVSSIKSIGYGKTCDAIHKAKIDGKVLSFNDLDAKLSSVLAFRTPGVRAPDADWGGRFAEEFERCRGELLSYRPQNTSVEWKKNFGTMSVGACTVFENEIQRSNFIWKKVPTEIFRNAGGLVNTAFSSSSALHLGVFRYLLVSDAGSQPIKALASFMNAFSSRIEDISFMKVSCHTRQKDKGLSEERRTGPEMIRDMKHIITVSRFPVTFAFRATEFTRTPDPSSITYHAITAIGVECPASSECRFLMLDSSAGTCVANWTSPDVSCLPTDVHKYWVKESRVMQAVSAIQFLKTY